MNVLSVTPMSSVEKPTIDQHRYHYLRQIFCPLADISCAQFSINKTYLVIFKLLCFFIIYCTIKDSLTLEDDFKVPAEKLSSCLDVCCSEWLYLSDEVSHH